MPDIESLIPTFFVADVRRAAEWYTRVLGFRVSFMHEESEQPVHYGGVELGKAAIHFARIEQRSPGVLYKAAFHLRLRSGVDSYIAEIEARGQRLVAQLKDHPDYGMREATVRDLDGNDIYISQPM